MLWRHTLYALLNDMVGELVMNTSPHLLLVTIATFCRKAKDVSTNVYGCHVIQVRTSSLIG